MLVEISYEISFCFSHSGGVVLNVEYVCPDI